MSPATDLRHTAQCLCGLRTTGLASLTGVPIPPRSGPARRTVMLETGMSFLHHSQRQYGRVLTELPQRVAVLLPPWQSLTTQASTGGVFGPSLGQSSSLQQRSAMWEQAQAKLRSLVNDSAYSQLEQRSRAALDASVAAFNFLEDEDFADTAHEHAHTVGEFVGRLFGCRAEYRDGRFWDVCPLSLMHLRIGLSPGFTAQRICSICWEDLSDPDACPHLPGVAVSVEVAERDGYCSACSGTWPCAQHLPGTQVDVVPHSVIWQADVQEISWVARPREPRARITQVEISRDRLQAQFGRIPSPVEPLNCHRCQQACTGLLTSKELLHRA